uniref:SFRICE_026996 n=1 Tax=Spodoptera frugiperda TaxID=7108 RepID=A0A2H1VBU4_SPOFR
MVFTESRGVRKFGGFSHPCLGKHVKPLVLRLTSLRSFRSAVPLGLESEEIESAPTALFYDFIICIDWTAK